MKNTEYAEAFIRESGQGVPNTYEGQRSHGHAGFVVDAARRAGLKVVVDDGTYLFLRGSAVVGAIRGMLSSISSSVGVSIAASKEQTKRLLAAQSLPVPAGNAWTVQQRAEAYDYYLSRLADGALQVLKPEKMNGGRGVYISKKDVFEEAWSEYLRLTEGKVSRFLVEDYAEGLDVRLLMIAGKCVACMTRVPANVVGDGSSSVEALVEAKNGLRAQHPHFKRFPITLDGRSLGYLREQGCDASSVIEEGRVVFFNGASNVSSGGDAYDVTDRVSSDLIHLASKAVSSIPGLGYAAVDMIVPDLASADGATIIEIEAHANMGIHYFPWYGTPRDVGQRLLEAFQGL